MAGTALLKVSVEMLLDSRIHLRITVAPFTIPQLVEQPSVCLITFSAGRDLKLCVFLNLDFVNPEVDISEIRLCIKLCHILS